MKTRKIIVLEKIEIEKIIVVEKKSRPKDLNLYAQIKES